MIEHALIEQEYKTFLEWHLSNLDIDSSYFSNIILREKDGLEY
jgi:hypothetical protein